MLPVYSMFHMHLSDWFPMGLFNHLSCHHLCNLPRCLVIIIIAVFLIIPLLMYESLGAVGYNADPKSRKDRFQAWEGPEVVFLLWGRSKPIRHYSDYLYQSIN